MANSRRGQGWISIKLFHLIHLTWNALYAEGKVSFRSIYLSADGIHGPGPALLKRGKSVGHVHLLDALFHIQSVFKENPDVYLFDISQFRRYGKDLYWVLPGGRIPTCHLHLSTLLPGACRDRDLEFMTALEGLIAELSSDEVRVLGTHQSKEGTLKAIEYNIFIQLFKRFADEISLLQPSSGRTFSGQGRQPQSDLGSAATIIGEVTRRPVIIR